MPTIQIEATDILYHCVGNQYPCLVMHGGLGLDHPTLSPWLDPLVERLHLM